MCLDRHTTSPEQGCLVPSGSDDLSELPYLNFWEPFLVLVGYMVTGMNSHLSLVVGSRQGQLVKPALLILLLPDSSCTQTGVICMW